MSKKRKLDQTDLEEGYGTDPPQTPGEGKDAKEGDDNDAGGRGLTRPPPGESKDAKGSKDSSSSSSSSSAPEDGKDDADDDDEDMQEDDAGGRGGTASPPQSLVLPLFKFTWTDEQWLAIQWAMSGKNVFVTGPLGSGKRLLCLTMVEMLRSRMNKNVVVVTPLRNQAPLYHGCTVSSFIGMPIGPRTAMLKEAATDPRQSAKYNSTDVVILMHVETMDAKLFVDLSLCFTAARATRPEVAAHRKKHGVFPRFGGAQVIVMGDFYGMPPYVEKNPEEEGVPLPAGSQTCRVFQTREWKRCDFAAVDLKHVKRQTTPAFRAVIQQLRVGRLSKESVQWLLGRKTAQTHNPQQDFTIAITTNKAERDRIQAMYSAALTSHWTPHSFDTHLRLPDKANDADREYFKDRLPVLLKKCPCPPKVTLTVGMIVMLQYDLPMAHVATQKVEARCGERGFLDRFDEKTGEPVVRFGPLVAGGESRMVTVPRQAVSIYAPGIGRVFCTGMMLQPGFALLLNEVYGQTVNRAFMRIHSKLKRHEPYAMISRVRDADGLFFDDFHANACEQPDVDVRFFYETSLDYKTKAPKLPKKLLQSLIDLLKDWEPTAVAPRAELVPTEPTTKEKKRLQKATDEAAAVARNAPTIVQKRLMNKRQKAEESKKRKQKTLEDCSPPPSLLPRDRDDGGDDDDDDDVDMVARGGHVVPPQPAPVVANVAVQS